MPAADTFALAQLLTTAMYCGTLIAIAYMIVLRSPPPAIEMLGYQIMAMVPTKYVSSWAPPASCCIIRQMNQVRCRRRRRRRTLLPFPPLPA